MVRIKRPTRSLASRRVSKDTDPSICSTAVKSEVEQHGIENVHTTSNGTNHDLEEGCSEHCFTTSDGYPVGGLDDNKNIATDQLSEPCDGDTKIITGDPGSTTFNNVSTDVKLELSEYRKKGSLFAVKPLKTYYRRKGFFRSVNPFKTYRRRRSGYMSFGTSPLPIQSSIDIDVEIADVNTTLEQSMELDPSEKSDIIVDKTCDVRSQPERADEELLPEQSPSGSIKKKLLVLDINGLLADIVPVARVPHEYKPDPDTIIAGKAVFKRPFCDDFLEFCFERFNVGVWSSRTKKNVDFVLNFIMGEKRQNLLFCWDQSHCTGTRFFTPDNSDKPILLKKLSKLWENSETDLPWKSGDHDDSDTLLLDDSPYKALLNPPNTAIFPQTYQYSNEKDNSLGPDGDLRIYLEGLSMAPNVQEYVKHNPYGQNPITDKHAKWSFYHEVIESTAVDSLRKSYQSSELRKDVSQVNDIAVVAETSKEFLGSNGAFQQHEKKVSTGSPCSTQRGYKRFRSQSPRHEVSKRQSRSLSPKKNSRSKSPAPSHGGDFMGDKTTNYQTLRPEYRNFPQGRFPTGTTCRFEHHQSHSRYKSYADKGVQEHESQIFKPQLAPRECYNFIQGRCNWGASCRFSHSIPEKTDLALEGTETHDKQCDDIRRDKVVPRECYDFIQGNCKWGANCRFQHSLPGKADIGTEGRETDDKKCGNIRRDKAVPRECRDLFVHGKCSWGASCRFSHSIPEKTDLALEGTETHDKQCDDVRRDRVVPRECYDFIQGNCKWGANCRFQHSLPGTTDIGTGGRETDEKKCGNIRSDKASPRECRDFLQGNCSRGASCWFQHSMPDKNDIGTEGHETPDKHCHNIRRENAMQQPCNDFIRGKCNFGTSCRYLHSVPEKTDISFHNRYYQDVTSSSKLSDECGKDQSSSFNEHGRYKPVAEVCRNYSQGRCYKGSHCQYSHQESGLLVGSRSTDSQPGDTSRFTAVREVCRKYIWGRCQHGFNCRHLHQEPNLTGPEFTSQVVNMNRYKAMPELCRNYSQGRCYKGSDCRFQHPEPFISVRSGSISQHGETSRFKTVSEVCRNYTKGRCPKGSDCRYLHQEQSPTFGMGSSAQFGETGRYQAPPEVCKNNVQDRCHNGPDRQYQHRELGLTFSSGSTGKYRTASRFIAPPQVCNNYTLGRCNKGSDCRYRHPEPGAGMSTWQNKVLPHPTTSPRLCVEHTQGKCWRGVHCRYPHHESDQRGSSTFYRSHQENGEVPLKSTIFGSFGDTGSICHETSVHERTESRAQESIPDFSIVDRNRDTVEPLPNQHIDREYLKKDYIVPDVDAKDIKHLESDVRVSIDGLGGADGKILVDDNSCHETAVHEDTEAGTKELIPNFPVIEENRGTIEALNNPVHSNSFQEASVDGDTIDKKVLDNVICASMDNLGDSDRSIQ